MFMWLMMDVDEFDDDDDDDDVEDTLSKA